MSLMKTIKYGDENYSVEVIQRAGGLVTMNGDEYPNYGDGFVDELIEMFTKNGDEFEVYYIDYQTGDKYPYPLSESSEVDQ